MNQISFVPRGDDAKPALPVLLWVLAFICGMYPLSGSQLECFAACVLLLFGWGYVMLARRTADGWKVPRTPVLWFAGAFWLLVAASVFWSPVKPISLMGLCFFSVMPLTFFAASISAPDKFFTWTARVLAGLFALMSVWAVIQFFFLNAYFMGQARHPLADPSTLGALFSLALFCSLGWVVSNRPAKERRFALILSLLLICGILSTVARGPIFAFLPGFALFVLLLWPQVKAARKSFLVLLLGTIAFAGLMQAGVEKKFHVGTRLMETVAPKVADTDITNSRMQVWETTVAMIKDHPWLGSGIATYALRYPQYRQPDDREGAFLAHNDPLQFWVELGILGPVLFYGFGIAAAIRTCRALRKKKEKPQTAPDDNRVMIVTVFSALAAMTVHSHVSFNHYSLPMLMLSGLLLAVWLLATTRALGEEPAIKKLSGGSGVLMNKAAVALPFVLMGWLFGSIMAGEHFASRARDALFAERMFEFADRINMAGRVSMGMNFRAYILAVNVPMSILQMDQEAKKTPDIQQQEKLYRQVVNYMDMVSAIHPLEPSPFFYRGRVQELVEKEVVPEGTPTPEEYYRKSIALDPVYLPARLALYKLYEAEGRSVQEKLSVLEPGFGFTYLTMQAKEYYEILARLYLDSGNMSKAQDVMRYMAYFQRLDTFSRQRLSTSIPEALTGGDSLMIRP